LCWDVVRKVGGYPVGGPGAVALEELTLKAGIPSMGARLADQTAVEPE